MGISIGEQGMRLITRIALNRKTIEIIFEQDDGRRIIMQFDPTRLDNLIRKLARSRSQMLPPPHAAPEPTTPVRLEAARIETVLDDASGLPALSLAIPGMGLARVVLPPQEANRLGIALQELVEECGGGRPVN